MSRGLPEGWLEVTLGQVIESMKNGVYRPAHKYADSGIACLRMYNIDNGRIVWKGVKRMTLSPTELVEYELLPGDLLVNRVNSRELVGKAAVIPEGLERCVFESKNIRVRLHRNVIEAEFANYALLLWGREHFGQNAQQVVGMASISQPQLASFTFPLAPLEEQRRIVAKLKTLIPTAEAIRERLDKASQLLKAFRQSVLAAACSGRLTADWREGSVEVEHAGELIRQIEESRTTRLRRGDDLTRVEVLSAEDLPDDEIPETWRWVRFGTVIGELRNGVSPRPNVEPPGTPILRISAVRPGTVDTTDVRYMPNGSDFLPTFDVRERDLLFTRYNGSIDLLGVCGMVRDIDRKTLLYPDKLMRVRFDHKLVLPEYAEIFFQVPSVHERLVAKSKSSAGQNGVSGSDIKAQAFALPPIREQEQIVTRVNELFAFSAQIHKQLADVRAAVDRIVPAALAKAFRGELVPIEADMAKREGRDYEAVAVLLGRLRLKQAASPQRVTEASTGRTARAITVGRKIGRRPTVRRRRVAS